MASINPAAFSDRDLLLETERAAARERHATAALLALLAEVDTRRLYSGQGFSSLFQYATKHLHLSEPAAYGRISAARAARRFPDMLRLVDEGALSLTTIGLLGSHLTDDNHASLLEAARYKNKREVEVMVARLHPQPDIRASIRMLPVERRPAVIPQLPIAPTTSRAPAEPLSGAAAAPPLDTLPTPRTTVQRVRRLAAEDSDPGCRRRANSVRTELSDRASRNVARQRPLVARSLIGQ